jgi:hypothetical protein
MTLRNTPKLIFAATVGFLFLLPHLVRMIAIGSYRQYTPFAAQSPSPMEWDETFLYGPEANYMQQRHQVANDTDTWEHRQEAFPYSILPIGVEAAAASVVGLGNTQMICHFLFPMVTAWLLMTMFESCGTNLPLGAALALILLAGAFSPRTVLLGDLALVRHGLHGGVFDTMQGARTPNPSISFPLYLGAMLCLSSALLQRSAWLMAGAGAMGGLLFYTYIYYAIPWSAGVLFVVLLGWALKPLEVPPSVVLAPAATVVVALPFLYWRHVSALSGSYQNRTNRLGNFFAHTVSRNALELSLIWGLAGAAGIAGRLWLGRVAARPKEAQRYGTVLLTVLGCALLGGLAGMNMQVVTGFNIQPEHHYPHMVLQPLGLTLLLLAFAGLTERVNLSRRSGAVLFAAVYLACCGSQLEAAVNSAEIHRMPETDRALFAWLGEHSDKGSMVATTDFRLCVVLPLYTHNGTLIADGTRSGASDAELVERFLLASALTRTPESIVQERLSQVGGITYSYYLFETSPTYFDSNRHRIKEQALPAVMQQYRELNLAEELKRFRLDYVWMTDGPPAEVTGVRWEKAFQTEDGTLWKLVRL